MDIPLWIQILALFGLPAVGSYVGIRVGLAELRGDVKRLEETTNLKISALTSRQEENSAEIRLLRKRSHRHSGLIGRIAMKIDLTGPIAVEEEHSDA